MGPERGGKAAAIAYTLIETEKLDSVDPQARLTDVLGRIVGRPVDEPVPWICAHRR